MQKIKRLHYKKLRLSDDYLYSSEREEEQKSIKDDCKTLIKQIIDEGTNINVDLFNKYFKESIVEIVEKILKFNKQNQQGEGMKILTPNQILNRLPIALAQLNAGNNSNKLKNEIM